MTVLEAVAYGLVQGLGEFLPISSSAHLTILPWLAGWSDPGLAFDVALHVGTLVALIVYFRRDLWQLFRGLVDSIVERQISWHQERRLAWLVVIGSIPGAIIGYALEDKAEEVFRQPWIIATTMILLGVGLYFADRLGKQTRPSGDLRLSDALWIGLAQAAAILPGVSRSGSTITAGRLVGLQREAAARFSFLLAAPIVAGAALVKVPHLAKAGGLNQSLAIAVVVAAVSGYVAIDVLLRLVRARSYLPFVVYRVLFGVGVFALYFHRGH